jgi:DNA mismatch repair ATPase MutS
MAQLGLLVPADEAEISPVDQILTHFPDGAEDTLDRGRLGEECNRLRQMFEAMTEHSLLLLDESLSSTGAFEATYIAGDVLLGFGLSRVRCIFSTHLHDLAAKVPQISEASVKQGGAGMDTMTAEMNPDGTRSFRVIRGTPDGKSYAADIAEKYGLSFREIQRTRADK